MGILEKLNSYHKYYILREIWQTVQAYDVEFGWNDIAEVNYDGRLLVELIEGTEKILNSCEFTFHSRYNPVIDTNTVGLTYDIKGDDEHYYKFTYDFAKSTGVSMGIVRKSVIMDQNSVSRVGKEIESLMGVIGSDEYSKHVQQLHERLKLHLNLDRTRGNKAKEWVKMNMFQLVIELYHGDPNHKNKMFVDDYTNTMVIERDYPDCVFSTYDSIVGRLYLRFIYNKDGIYVTVDNEPMHLGEGDGHSTFISDGERAIDMIKIPNEDYLAERSMLSLLIRKIINPLDVGESYRYNDVLAYRDRTLLYFYFRIGTSEACVCVHEETKFIVSCGFLEPFRPKPLDTTEGTFILTQLHMKLLEEI